MVTVKWTLGVAAAVAVACGTAYGEAHMTIPHGFNIKDYGAVGDGEADDTTPFQAAIDEAGTVSNLDTLALDPKAIYVPPGHYRITAPLRIDYTGKHGPLEGLKIIGTTGPHYRRGRPGPHGEARMYTELFWDGPEDGMMFDCWGIHAMEFTGMLLNGQGKTKALISVNSPRSHGSALHRFVNVHMVNSKVGFECGNDSYICSSDMSFYDCGWTDCDIGFRTLSEQNLNYNFVRCGSGRCGVMFDFAKGGSSVMTLPYTYGTGVFLRVGSGGINAGAFTVNGLRLDGCEYRGRRTVLCEARGETNIVFTGMLTSCTGGLFPKTAEEKAAFAEYNTPLFDLETHANVLVQGSMISGNIARLAGTAGRPPTWLQFDNCRFRVRSDPRKDVACDEHSGYEFRNCVVVAEDGAFMLNMRKGPKDDRTK